MSPSPAFVHPDQLNLPQPSVESPSPALLSDNPKTPKFPKSPNPNPQPKQQSLPVSAEKTNPTPTVIFGGSTINADWSSYYSLLNIVSLKPRGSDVDTNNIIYSFAPSATGIISNGNFVPLDHIEQPTDAKPEPIPILSFGTFISRRFVVAIYHLWTNSQAWWSSHHSGRHSDFLDAAGSVAVMGPSTRSLIAALPIQAPALTCAGPTFTANSAFQFIVAG